MTAGMPQGIAAVQRLELFAADTLVVHDTADTVDDARVAHIRKTVRRATGRPDLQVLVLAAGVHLGVIAG
jgi:hypothetical protein